MPALEFALDGLSEFLERAKRTTCAGGGTEVSPERLGFKELEYVEGDWNYRDSHTDSFYVVYGQEVVRFRGKSMPVWVMSYCGGMRPDLRQDEQFARETFEFLKEALLRVNSLWPFRGSHDFRRGDFEYCNKFSGNVRGFSGHEKVFSFKRGVVFELDYFGGIVVGR